MTSRPPPWRQSNADTFVGVLISLGPLPERLGSRGFPRLLNRVTGETFLKRSLFLAVASTVPVTAPS